MATVLSLDQTPSETRTNLHGVVGIAQRGNSGYVSEQLTESRSLPALNRMAYFIAHDFRHHLCAIYAKCGIDVQCTLCAV